MDKSKEIAMSFEKGFYDELSKNLEMDRKSIASFLREEADRIEKIENDDSPRLCGRNSFREIPE